MLPMTILTKVANQNYEISNLINKNEIATCNVLGNAKRKTEESKIGTR